MLLRQGGEIIFKNKSRLVLRIANTAGTLICRTKIAGRVVLRTLGGRDRLDGALPGAPRAVRRHQHPFVSERIEAAMGFLAKFQVRLVQVHSG